MMAQINEAILQHPLEGLNLPPGTTLHSLTTDQTTLLVFLRHFG
jgi:hypothetical protein